jgi:hypothetical protein
LTVYDDVMANFVFQNPGRRRNGPPTLGGKIGATLFLLIFLAFGVGFTCLMSGAMVSAVRQRSWSAVPCIITRSTITDNRKPSAPNYRLNVAYTYAANGHPRTGTLIRTGYTGSSDYYQAQKLADAYSIGSHATCRVDPADSGHAILQTQDMTFGFFILIPLIFILIGGGGIFMVWKPSSPAPPSTSSAPGKAPGRNNTLVVSALFFLAGFLFLVLWFVPMVSRMFAARSWPQVPCTIVHSGVSSHSGNKGGTTYAVEVLYRYQFNGKKFASSRYDFMAGSSSGYDSKQDIVRTLPARKKTVCYVDPADPEYAVLNRGYSMTLLFGLIPVIFVLVGAIGFARAMRRRLSLDPTGGPSLSPAARAAPSPLAAAFGSILIAAFWNGIVSVFVMETISSWKHGHPDYFLGVFLIPFVLVGLLLICNIFYRFWKLLV